MLQGKLLITGSSGLIGRAVARRVRNAGWECIGIDLRERGERRIDIVDTDLVESRLQGVSGVIHLAAVSRVIAGEQDPELCRAVNVAATHGILRAAQRACSKPWVLYASSREIYGQQDEFPVSEDAAHRPKNTYAKSKADAEALVEAARQDGLQTSIVRFSNVYGSIRDYPDRVVPAFVAAAVRGRAMHVEGGDCALDFTHVGDVADGVMRVVEMLARRERNLAPVHFVSGQRTTLHQLARLANEINGRNADIVECSARPHGVRTFVGNPERARALLGWSVSTDLRTGIANLSREFWTHEIELNGATAPAISA